MHFLPNHSPARPAHMAAEEATHVSPRSVVSQGRGKCVSGPSLTAVLLQRPSHSRRCSCQLRMLAASSSLRRNAGSRQKKSVIWGVGGHEAWSSSVPQARRYKTCPAIPLVRAGAMLCTLPWAWPCSPQQWRKWVYESGELRLGPMAAFLI